MLTLAVALVAAALVAGRVQPVRAELIDKVIVKNELAYGTVYYGVVKSVGWQSGCLMHRQQYDEGFLIRPVRVEFRVYRTPGDCANKRNVLYSASMNYWAPKTTYTVTGSPDYKDFRVSEQH